MCTLTSTSAMGKWSPGRLGGVVAGRVAGRDPQPARVPLPPPPKTSAHHHLQRGGADLQGKIKFSILEKYYSRTRAR